MQYSELIRYDIKHMISAKKTNKPKYDFHSESRNFLRKHTTRKIILNEIRLYLKRLI